MSPECVKRREERDLQKTTMWWLLTSSSFILVFWKSSFPRLISFYFLVDYKINGVRKEKERLTAGAPAPAPFLPLYSLPSWCLRPSLLSTVLSIVILEAESAKRRQGQGSTHVSRTTTHWICLFPSSPFSFLGFAIFILESHAWKGRRRREQAKDAIKKMTEDSIWLVMTLPSEQITPLDSPLAVTNLIEAAVVQVSKPVWNSRH